jgi:peptidoglycan/LPS O-acetylase OafA/YrhL/lysophospholipase L1-like esterase
MTTTAPEVEVRSAPPAVASNGARTHLSYRPALDGLRAVAVMAVIAYHFGAGWLQGGFLGVDLFFVLSGYLITSLLLLEWGRSHTIHFGGFWARRARRLLPALFLVLIAVALWGRFVLVSDQWGALRSDSIWTLFYGANWHFIWSGQSYFTAEPSMLRHAWSLAIEEQFYLVWPLVVFACLRLARGRHALLAALCVVGSAASVYVTTSHFSAGTDPSRAYYGTDARASQLLVGALLGILLIHWAPKRRVSRLALQWIGVLGAVAIGFMFWNARDHSPALYRGGFLVFAICAAVVIAAMVQPSRNPLRGVLCIRPVRWIGAVSYGVYLWHFPVSVALTTSRLQRWGWDVPGWELTLLRLGATFGLAALSYYLVELPIRQRRFAHRWTPYVLAPAAVAVTAAVILFSTVGATHNPLSAAPGTVLERKGNVAPLMPNPAPTITLFPTQRVLLLGDSVAYTLGDALSAEAAKDGVALETIGRLGCSMTTGIALADGAPVNWGAVCANDTIKYQTDALDQYRPDTLMWLSTWETSDYEVNGETLKFGTPAFDDWLLGEMERVRELGASRGARLVFVTSPPTAPNPQREVDPVANEKIDQLNALYGRFAAEHPQDVTVVDISPIVCPGGAPCPTTLDGVVLRPKDGGHYEAEGAAWLAPRLLDGLYTQLRAQAERYPTTTTTAP